MSSPWPQDVCRFAARKIEFVTYTWATVVNTEWQHMFGPTDPKASNLRASPQASPKLTNQRSKSVAAASTVMPAVGSPVNKKGLVVPPTNPSQAKSPSPSRALNSQLSSNSRDLSGCKVALDQVWPLNQLFCVSFLWKIIDLPGGQINDPSSGKHYSLPFLPATTSRRDP